MSITEICIRRPVLSTVLSLVVIVLGLISQSKLPIRQNPQVEKSTIVVETEYHGASPRVVETAITQILEGQFATIPGIDLIRSKSSNEKSEITMEFAPERTPDGAASDVRDRLSISRNMLPYGIPESIIRKDRSGSEAGIYIGFTSTMHTIDQLRDYVDKYVKSRFEALPGVGRVNLAGGNVLSMRLFLDPQKLAAYGYTPADVVNIVDSQHTKPACGSFISKDREYMISFNGELNTPEQFDEMVLPPRDDRRRFDGQVIRLKDVGKAKLVPDDIKAGAWFNGQECVTLSIAKQATANPIELSKIVRAKMPEIQESLPTGVKAVLSLDEAEDIQASMSNVYRAIFEATALVILVVFLFLWSFRAALIPIVAIPVSLLGTFGLLEIFGFSINMFTLLAMVLAVGLVVDDAIVVLENVHRYMEKGMSRFKAAIVGSREIFFSIIAMTLTLATAYIPIALTPGRIGAYFREFALTLSGAVIISGFVALTLSPMMCSKFLSVERRKKATGKWKSASDAQANFLKYIDEKYKIALAWAVDRRLLVLGIGAVVALLGVLVVKVLPSESWPVEDTGQIDFTGNGPAGASYSFMEDNAKVIDKVISETPFITNRWVQADTSEIKGWLRLKDWSLRNKTSVELAADLQKRLRRVPGVRCNASAGYNGGDGKASIEFVLQTNQNYDYLMRYGNRFLWTLQESCDALQKPMRSSIVPAQAEYMIDFDRAKAASLGVQARDIGDTISFFIQGKKAANVQRGAKRDELFIQVERDLRTNPEDLNRMFVRSRYYNEQDGSSNMVPLSDLITIKEGSAPTGVNHYNQMLSVVAYANVAEGHSLGEAVEKINQIKEKYLPNTMQLTFAGGTRSYLEESRQIVMVFLLALVFVFLILAAQFESFIDPLIIMLSVPFSITGALITLWLVPDCSLNIYSKVGLVTLIGLITKHGILIVDFANSLLAQGKSIIEAVKEAAHLRLRPILMTTFAMVIGTVPLALASGAGAAARRQIGWAIVGGMSFGTLFTLFIVPIIYIYFARLKSTDKLAEDEE